MQKLKSRKFWMAVIGAAIVIVNEVFDMGLSPESQAIIAGVIVSFIVMEGAKDVKSAGKEVAPGDTGPAE